MSSASVEDLYLHVTLTSLVADGPRVAWVATCVQRAQDNSTTCVWTWSQEDGVERVAEDGSSPQVSPDGRQVAFIAMRDQPEICVWHGRGGQLERVSTAKEEVTSILQWGAAGKQLLVISKPRAGVGGDEPYRVGELPYKQDGTGVVVEHEASLGWLDIDDGTIESIDAQGLEVLEARWCATAGRLAFVTRSRGHQRHCMQLWIKEGKKDPFRTAEDHVSFSGLQWSPDGQRLAFSGSKIEGDSIGLLCLWEFQGGQVETQENVELAIPSAIAWDGTGRLIVNQVHRGLQRIIGIGLNGDIEQIVAEPMSHCLAMAAGAANLAVVVCSPVAGSEIFTADKQGRSLTQVSDFNAWRKDRPELRCLERWFRVADGNGGFEDVQGWVLSAPGEGPRPLLLDMHGGPHSIASFEFERLIHWPVLAEKGWAILALNAVGSNSYGLEFAHRLCGHWGELDYPQWEEVRRQLRVEGIASDVAACFGHSYGGFLSAWALGHDAGLSCGVVSGGVINLISHTGTSDTGYYVGPYAMGGELRECAQRYWELSPLAAANGIHVPTLILQGDADERCPRGQGEELLAELLRRGGVKAEMLVFPSGSHHLSSTGRPSHRVRYYSALVDWLEDARTAVNNATRADQ